MIFTHFADNSDLTFDQPGMRIRYPSVGSCIPYHSFRLLVGDMPPVCATLLATRQNDKYEKNLDEEILKELQSRIFALIFLNHISSITHV